MWRNFAKIEKKVDALDAVRRHLCPCLRGELPSAQHAAEGGVARWRHLTGRGQAGAQGSSWASSVDGGQGLTVGWASLRSADMSSGAASGGGVFGGARGLPGGTGPGALRGSKDAYGLRILERLGRGEAGARRSMARKTSPPSTTSSSTAASASAGRAASSRGQRLREESRQAAAKKSSAMLLYLAALVVAMVGTTYAAVPLYRMFCQATGFGGTIQRRETVEEKIARHDSSDVAGAARQRELTIHFNADVADGMPWRFLPSQREVKVRPGQSTLAFYTAHNLSPEAITGVSTYNVAPMKAGAYFNKIQCFCFEEQRLRGGEKVDMPVFFYIDPEFATDPKMKDVNSLTLSYTFFKVEDDKA